MTKKIIKYYIILLVMFFSWAGVAHADVIFNEIAWKGTATANGGTHEWIELLGTSGENISGWTISDEINQLNIVIPDSSKISSTGFYVIKRTTSDITPYDLPTAFSGGLSDAGEKLILSNSNGEIKQTLDFSSGWPNATMTSNQTMQWNGSSWITASPTPGAINSGISNTDSSDNSSEENIVDETVDPIPLIKDAPIILKITTKIVSPKIVTAGIPFSLSSLTTTNRGETYAVGKFVWNFGDGMVREIGEANPFEYTYQYPGDYALTLSYYNSTFSVKPDAVDKITIKVVPAGINISSVGNASDPFVEIENKSSYEIVLSNWVVTAGIHYFIIPEGTTLLSNKKIKLSPKITGFVGEDLNSIIISNQSKEIIATYPTEIKKLAPRVSSTSLTTPYINPIQADSISPDDSFPQDSQVINLNDLGASAGESGANIPKSIYPIIGLLVVIGLGVASFLLIKKKRNVGDYVEQGISAKDMTIIE